MNTMQPHIVVFAKCVSISTWRQPGRELSMRTPLLRVCAAVVLSVLCGCTTSGTRESPASERNAPQVPENHTAERGGAKVLPINPLVQELRNQALQGVQFFPMFQPRSFAEVDVTTKIKEWQDKELPDANALQRPHNGVFDLEGTSVFMLEPKGNGFVATWGIPVGDGKITSRGAIWQVSTMAVGGGGQITSTVLSGIVWTPRLTVIGAYDLAGNGRVTTSPDFDFEAFKHSPGVIPFANGYAVNLFGANVDERGVVNVNSRLKGNYLTNDGRPLCGRLIRNRFGKLEEITFMP